MEKVLMWVGVAAVVIFALIGVGSVLGVNVHAGGGYAGVSWDQTDCNYCGVRRDDGFLNSVYRR